MRALDKKLVRDLRRLWAQALAVALVMACGAATLIMAVGSYRALSETRAAYYERYRFGDVFASAVRAPNALAATIGAIDGVASVETRVLKPVLLDIPGLREPATGLAISLPPTGEPAVNALFLREGRIPEPGRANEVAVNATFAAAHGFSVGSTFSAIVNGAKISLLVVGIVLSPEYVYALGPGDLMPDNRRFGILWMPEKTLAALFDLEGAFNSVSLRLLHDGDETAVTDALDRALAPYGGTGAHGRKDQMSNAFLDSELTQLDAMGRIIPPIFLAVAAFLINMILSRLIALEREQIGLLKAIGYGRFAVVWHYLKLVIVIAAAGGVLGAAIGTWAGHELTVVYSRFYSFPFLLFRPAGDIYVLTAAVSVLAAIAGAFTSVRTAFALPAAVAMQPPAPPVYRRILQAAASQVRIFSALTTMALRHLWRHPVRTGLTALGIAMSVALIEIALGTLDSVDGMINGIYYQADRQDMTIAFAGPRGPDAVNDVAHLPGIMRVEPYLIAPVRISNGHYSRQLSITGKPPGTDLSRVLDVDGKPVVLPETGLALGDRVADILKVSIGDLVRVELLEGARRTADVPITAIIQSYLGLAVFMDITALARLMGTGPRVSGIHVALDQARLDDLYATVKETPTVAAVALQTVSRQRLQETMRENLTISLSIYYGLAIVIAFGVLYNSARIQLSERARELATLRVIGFGKLEVANVLFIEIGVVVVLAQPLGWLIGTGVGYYITQALATDLFRVPFVVQLDTYALATLIVAGAAAAAAVVVHNRVNRLDLIRVLKTRE
jgi:putative ABC transport system permease protein